ncbi:unnamed protein product [Urochloa humidicola]
MTELRRDRAQAQHSRVETGSQSNPAAQGQSPAGAACSYKAVNRSGAEADDMVVSAGLGGLRKEVSTCEYHDVHVMWEMLSVSSSNTNAGKVASKRMEKKEKRGSLPVAYWSRLLSCCGAL